MVRSSSSVRQRFGVHPRRRWRLGVGGGGDIAVCGTADDEATAKLLDSASGTSFTLGDNVYPSGTTLEFSGCYASSWGQHKDRTRPSAGNREYETVKASGYFGYFGAGAGDRGKGYYSHDRDSWHIIVLNSNCQEVSCAEGSAQERWLENDLAANPNACTLASPPVTTETSPRSGETSTRPAPRLC